MRLTSIIFLLCCTFSLKAQHSISSNYTNNYIGQDIDINYNYQFKRSKLSAGLSFFINRDWRNDPNWEIFFKIFHAHSLLDRIGYRFGYDYLFPTKSKKTFFYLSYDLRYRYGQTKSHSFIYKDEVIRDTYILKEYTSTMIHAFSNIIGFGLSTKLGEKISLNGKIGTGADTFYITDERNKETTPDYGSIYLFAPFSLSYLVSVGLEYKFIKKVH